MHKNGLGLDKKATKKDEEEEIHRIFRETFKTEDGKKCLNFILNDLLYFDVCRTQDEQALANYGKILVNQRLGITDTIALSDFMIENINNI